MSFYINNSCFSFNHTREPEQLEIKSYNKTYTVEYCEKNVNELISILYNPGDFIFIDKNVFELANMDNIKSYHHYLFHATEKTKTMETVLQVVDLLIQMNFKKTNKIIVIGGGITQDVAGFVASIFKRGVQWILIPTTLLSMTDSAIGGKVCINREIKNILSIFNAPSKIIISSFFLQSLHENDIISGLGEAYKIALIGGEDSLNRFYQHYETKDYKNIILLSNIIKKQIIEHDEFDSCERKALNYGHTFGHSLESASDYFIPHGIAVLYGMYLINKIFYNDKYASINKYIIDIIPEKFKMSSISYTTLVESVLNDKKNNGDNVCFILLEDVGKTVITYSPFYTISVALLHELQSLFVNSDK